MIRAMGSRRLPKPQPILRPAQALDCKGHSSQRILVTPSGMLSGRVPVPPQSLFRRSCAPAETAVGVAAAAAGAHGWLRPAIAVPGRPASRLHGRQAPLATQPQRPRLRTTPSTVNALRGKRLSPCLTVSSPTPKAGDPAGMMHLPADMRNLSGILPGRAAEKYRCGFLHDEHSRWQQHCRTCR